MRMKGISLKSLNQDIAKDWDSNLKYIINLMKLNGIIIHNFLIVFLINYHFGGIFEL